MVTFAGAATIQQQSLQAKLQQKQLTKPICCTDFKSRTKCGGRKGVALNYLQNNPFKSIQHWLHHILYYNEICCCFIYFLIFWSENFFDSLKMVFLVCHWKPFVCVHRKCQHVCKSSQALTKAHTFIQ